MTHLKNLIYNYKFASMYVLCLVALIAFYVVIGVPLLFTFVLATVGLAWGLFLGINARTPHLDKLTFMELLYSGKAEAFIKGDQTLDSKLILKSFENGHASITCQLIYRHAQSEQILNRLGNLSSKEKVCLLSSPALNSKSGEESMPVFAYLLDRCDDHTRMLRALFKGLSSKERLEVILSDKIGNFFLGTRITTELVGILFEGMTAADRLTVLSTDFGSKGSGLRHSLNLLLRSRSSRKVVEVFLRTLVNGLPIEQLKPLLADKSGLNSRQIGVYKVKNPHENYTALDILMLDNVDENAASVANLLIEYGALEADPECDFKILSKKPNINLTLYRNKLKAELKDSKIFGIEGLDELVCDYLIGERAPKRANPN